MYIKWEQVVCMDFSTLPQKKIIVYLQQVMSIQMINKSGFIHYCFIISGSRWFSLHEEG